MELPDADDEPMTPASCGGTRFGIDVGCAEHSQIGSAPAPESFFCDLRRCRLRWPHKRYRQRRRQSDQDYASCHALLPNGAAIGVVPNGRAQAKRHCLVQQGWPLRKTQESMMAVA